MGTRFLATREMPVHDNLKEALLNAEEKDTRLIMRTLRNTERVWHNGVVDQVLAIESKGNTTIADIAPLVSGSQGRAMYESGDLNQGIWSVGQVVGLIRDVPTVKELIDRIIAEAKEIVSSRLPSMIS
jgi:nitronate monooxygenase